MKWPPSPANREPSSSSFAVPAVGVEAARVDQIAGRHGLRAGPNRVFSRASSGANRRLNPTMSRSLPVVVDDVEDRVELVVGERERLLDEDRLPGLQGPADQVRMRVVPGHDEDRVERRRRRGRRLGVGRGGREAEPALRVDGRQ